MHAVLLRLMTTNDGRGGVARSPPSLGPPMMTLSGPASSAPSYRPRAAVEPEHILWKVMAVYGAVAGSTRARALALKMLACLADFSKDNIRSLVLSGLRSSNGVEISANNNLSCASVLGCCCTSCLMVGAVCLVDLVCRSGNGKVREVTGASCGYEFIEYETDKEMRRAYEDAHHSIIDRSEVIVDYYMQQLMLGWIPKRLALLTISIGNLLRGRL